jgi:hypothetical protein
MKVEFFTSGSIEKTVEKMHCKLEEKGFVFSENEKSFAVHYSNGQIHKTQTWSRFWARKQMEAPYSPLVSIEIEGEVVLEGENSVIKADFMENHANRRHGAGGSRAIDEHVDLFCEIFRLQ